MLDKFPKAFGFVLVDNIYSSSQRFFDAGSVFGKFITFIFLFKFGHFEGSIKNNGDLGVGEVHVAICFRMVDSKAVIVVDNISCVFVGSMRNKFKDDMA